MPDSPVAPPATPIVERKPDPADGDNYAYWRANGGKWADEYDLRKLVQPYYHIQELMLCDYVAHLARGREKPLRVLEFGCGVGRHLRYLSKLPNVEAFGHDQSPTMVRGCLRWTGQDWIDSHIRLGSPTGRIDADDASFDLVYTSEVLIHVRPEHLQGVLSELIRVSRGHILHFEPGAMTEVSREAHHGCWNHDLVGAYAAMGLTAEILPQGFRLQTPVRWLGADRSAWAWSPVMLELYRRLESDLEAGLAKERAHSASASKTAAELATAARALAAAQAERDTARAQLLKCPPELLAAKAAELTATQRETDTLRERITDLLERLKDRDAQALSLKASHTRAMTDLAASIQAEAREARRRAEEHEAELRRDAEHWRSLAATAERDRDAARQTAAAATARTDHLLAERATFLAEAQRRLTC